MPPSDSVQGPFPSRVLTTRGDSVVESPISRQQRDAAAKYPDPPPNWHASMPHDAFPATGGLAEWSRPGGREDLALDAAIDQREHAERVAKTAIPDVYEVADAVLAPLLGKTTSVPRRLRAAVDETLTKRGAKLTRGNRLAEAARMAAQDRLADDPEMSLALLLRAALLFKPDGGWQTSSPRSPHGSFPSVRALLAAAFSERRLGAGEISFEVAQNRARTHSLPGEVHVVASRCGTSRAKNADAIERACDAQRILAKSNLHPADILLLFEKLVLDRFKRSDKAAERRALVSAARARHARVHSIALPPLPHLWGIDADGTPKPRPKKPTPSEQDHADTLEATWFEACGVALHGLPEPSEEDAGAPSQATVDRHIAKHDRGLLALIDEAEQTLRKAIGQERRSPHRKGKPRLAPPPGALIPLFGRASSEMLGL